jgi:hypothetical protein
VKVINNYRAYRTDCKEEMYALILFYLCQLSSRQKVTNFDVSLTVHLSITFVKANLTHNIFVL